MVDILLMFFKKADTLFTLTKYIQPLFDKLVARDKNENYKIIQTLEYIDDEIADAYLDIFTEELLCKISIDNVDFNQTESGRYYKMNSSYLILNMNI